MLSSGNDMILVDDIAGRGMKEYLVRVSAGFMGMGKDQLDFVLVPIGLFIMVSYHLWLFYAIIRSPKSTVVGLNALSRRRWVRYMMAEPKSTGVLAVQTIRNSIMASTLLATTAITLSSLIGVVVSMTKDSDSSVLIFGNSSPLVSSVKFFTILLCFLLAFLFNVQSIRYYAHTSFLITVSRPHHAKGSLDYVVRSLNRGAYFWSLGLRSFYFSLPLFLWVFGPIPMILSSSLLTYAMYFLDTTTADTQKLHDFLDLEDIDA